eukprot:Rhum_TRINITY_DN13095_c0_g1::Rhum_TRINITY_DN13095_c0_g1_i2::g.56867::m.56867
MTSQAMHVPEEERGGVAEFVFTQTELVRHAGPGAGTAGVAAASRVGATAEAPMLPHHHHQQRRRAGAPHHRVLAAGILALFAAVVWLSAPSRPLVGGSPSGGGGGGNAPAKQPQTPAAAPEMEELVMVAGHSVLTGTDHGRVESEGSWFLERLQTGQLSTYLRHMQRGVELAAENPRAAVVYSGGQTRGPAGPRSEGASYWVASAAEGWWGHPEVASRAWVEEYARDSFENLLFSMCRFREVYGVYPRWVTVVSYSYKRERFESLHREALRFPLSRFKYVGVDPESNPYTDAGNIEKFTADPYGCGEKSTALRSSRNPFHRTAPYSLTCPEMQHLLSACGPTLIGKDDVPWASLHEADKQH